MRNLITGIVAALSLTAAFVGSASADTWMEDGGPGVVLSQSPDTTNTALTKQYAYEQNSGHWLRQGGPGAVVVQNDDTANIDPTGQYAYVDTSGRALHRDAPTENLARAEEGEATPDLMQHAQNQSGQTISQSNPSPTHG